MIGFSLPEEILKTVSIRKLLLPIILGLLALWPLLVNIKAISYNCYNAVDFSIYQQAIYDIWTLKDPNPFVSIRNVKIFNDHFDPVLYLAVAFTALFGQGFQQLLVFEWFFFLGLLASIFFIFKRNLKVAFPYLLCTLLTKLLLVSFLYPIHPTTWSSLILFWLTYFIVKNKKLPLAITVPLLCLFKESYAFALFPLGFYYAWKREFRLAGSIAISTLFFMAFELIFREKLLGPVVGYGGHFAEALVKNPISFFKDVMNFNLMPFIKMFYPFILCFFFCPKKLKGQWAVFLVFAPLLFLQVYANNITHQYASQFGGILIGLLVSLKALHGLSQKKIIITLVVFYLSSMGTYTKMFRSSFLNEFGGQKCLVTSGKIAQNQMVKNKIASIPRNEVILSTGGIVPFVMLPGKTIDHYMNKAATKKEFYHYIILELNRSGDIYPAAPEDVEGVLARCRPLATEILIENRQLFFARGDFQDCVYEKRELQKATPVE